MRLDLRDSEGDKYRATLFEELRAADVGDELTAVADDDLDPHLVRYQLDHEQALDWEHEDPDAEPRTHHITVGEPTDDPFATIDVRDLKPQRRHESLLEIFDDLSMGEGFVLVNDHDPKPLYHEFRSTHGDIVDWEYRSTGGGEWRVEVVKTDDSTGTPEDVVTRYDVREIPNEERHPTIHHRYGMVPEGGTIELVAPHEPRPLEREFRQQYGDSFTWEVVETEPGRCRVQITKQERAEDSEAEDDIEEGSADTDIEVVEEFDVRDRPPAKRHERIYGAYDDLSMGEGFVFVNDHDPKPLYHQFDAEEGPEFHWEYRQQEPGEFKVLIAKSEGSADEPGGTEVESPF